MKLYFLFALLVLSTLLAYKAQGIRLTKTSSSEKSSQDDDQLIAKTGEISSGINRKLMTKITASSSTTAIVSKNLEKKDGNKHDPKPEDKSVLGLRKEDPSNLSSSEDSKHWKKEFITEQYPDVIDIAGMDYTPARKKSPIHN